MMNEAKTRLVRCGGAALLLSLFVAWTAATALPPDHGDERTVRATVRSFTTAPKGEVDGMVLSDDTVVHWPPHLENRFKDIAVKGDRVSVVGRMETKPKGEKVLEIRTLTNLRTGVARSNDEDDRPPPKKGKKGKNGPKGPKGRVVGEYKSVRGTVDRFTSAPKGEVDGMVLSDDTAVHWPPHLENRFKDIVVKGDRVEVIGRVETGPRGDTKLEARTITNVRTGTSRTNEDVPAPPPSLQGREGSKPADTEKRLRAVEDKLDQLLEEIRQLKRRK